MNLSGLTSSVSTQSLSAQSSSTQARKQGPPPPPKDDSSASSIESALLSVGVEEASADELVSQIIDSLEQLAADSDGNATTDEIRSALASVLEENSVDTEAFSRSLTGDIDEGGFVIDRYV